MNEQVSCGMGREKLAQHYQQLHEQAIEKSADWYVYGHASGLLMGSGSLAWVRKELVKAREQCLQYAADFGFYADSEYGTYGDYMRFKVRLYEEVLSELTALENDLRALELLKQEPQRQEELRRQAPKYIDRILQDLARGHDSIEKIQTELAETALSNWELEPAKSMIAVLELLGELVPERRDVEGG